MSTDKIQDSERSTKYGNILVVTIFFYLLFAGFLIGKDLFYFDDPGSALSVLFTYGLLAILATLHLIGKRRGLLGVMVLCVILIISQILYIIAFITQPTVDSNLHSPFDDLLVTSLNSLFPLLTLAFSIKLYKET